MEYQFSLTEQAAQPTLSVRTTTSVSKLPEELGKVYHEIIDYLHAIGEEPVGPAFAAYYNMDMERLDVEMGFVVARPLPGKGEIVPSEIPAGKQVAYLHQGPYAASETAYKALMQWIEENGHQATGVVYEFYYNGPHEVPESELKTNIVFPLK